MRSGGECVEASEGVRKRRRLGGSAPTSVTRRTRVVVHACGVARKSDARRASRVRTSGNTARTPIEVARVASLASAVVERKQHFGPFEKIWTARVPFKCLACLSSHLSETDKQSAKFTVRARHPPWSGTTDGRRAGTRHGAFSDCSLSIAASDERACRKERRLSLDRRARASLRRYRGVRIARAARSVGRASRQRRVRTSRALMIGHPRRESPRLPRSDDFRLPPPRTPATQWPPPRFSSRTTFSLEGARV